ncbi:hypothetical protein ACM66B_004984 [Microbotryomycetes sp. NB124-2]
MQRYSYKRAHQHLLHPALRSPSQRAPHEHDWSDSEADVSDEDEQDSILDEKHRGRHYRKVRPRHAPRTRLYMRIGIGVLVAIILIVLLWWLGPDAIDSLTSKREPQVPASVGATGQHEGSLIETMTSEGLSASSTSELESAEGSQTVAAEKMTSSSTSATAARKTETADSKASTKSSGNSSSGSGPGMFGVKDPVCGDSGAVEKSGPGVGPNGAQSWLNCGLSEKDKNSPWTPPQIEISQLKYIALEEAVKLDTFKACAQWVDLFNKVGKETKLPPVFLASIAMTESSCRGDAVAPGGASWGLMQITTDKCGDAPGGDCNNPEFNVKKGAEYFNTVLKERGGFLQALGAYNGWVDKMTWAKATAIASEACERQNNLDYLQSVLNGLLLGAVSSTMSAFRRTIDFSSDRPAVASSRVARKCYKGQPGYPRTHAESRRAMSSPPASVNDLRARFEQLSTRTASPSADNLPLKPIPKPKPASLSAQSAKTEAAPPSAEQDNAGTLNVANGSDPSNLIKKLPPPRPEPRSRASSAAPPGSSASVNSDQHTPRPGSGLGRRPPPAPPQRDQASRPGVVNGGNRSAAGASNPPGGEAGEDSEASRTELVQTRPPPSQSPPIPRRSATTMSNASEASSSNNFGTSLRSDSPEQSDDEQSRPAPSAKPPPPIIPPRPAVDNPGLGLGRPPPPIPLRAATTPATTSAFNPSLLAPTPISAGRLRAESESALSSSPENDFVPPPPRRSPSPCSSLSRQPTLSSRPAIPARPQTALLTPEPTEPAPEDGLWVPPPPPSRAVIPNKPITPLRPRVNTLSTSGDAGSSDEDDEPPHDRSQEFPDATFANRRPPALRNRKPIHSAGQVHSFAVRGNCVVTGQHHVYVWSTLGGPSQAIMPPAGETKITAVEFRPCAVSSPEDDGRYAWVGTKDGHLFEIDTNTAKVTHSRPHIHVSSVSAIFRSGRMMVTIDEAGKVYTWGAPDSSDAPDLSGPHQSQRTAEKQNFAGLLGSDLWTSSGPATKTSSSALAGRSPQVRVYDPTGTRTFSLLPRPHLVTHASGPVGAVTASAIVPRQENYAYLGHDNGYVTVWDRASYECVRVQRVSTFMITSMAGVGKMLWAGFRTGYIYVYDVSQDPWTVHKAWRAHKDPVLKIVLDPSGLFTDGVLQVASLGSEMVINLWDGLLREDWLDAELNMRQPEFCTYRTIRTLCVTWNIDASKPTDLVGTADNLNFLHDVLSSIESPDIISFGFQEMIDLEDKKLTAKSMLIGKKQSGGFSDGVSSSYRVWHDKLVQAVRLAMPPDTPYTVVHVADMIGLFSCIFVKTSEAVALRDTAKLTVKTGMGGRYGNKGAIVSRFVVDDTSVCFINCHLAAGQSHRRQRDHDLVDILEDRSSFVGLGSTSPGAYALGSDGSAVFDHELCILSGDLNYRIDARRDNVVAAVESGSFVDLLPLDQLNKGLATNPTFRLRSFKEPVITFAPTYKYDRGTDQYDSSAKKRIPAWCDRILYRADRAEKITPVANQYRRWEVNVSDHRPVSSVFDLQVKSIIPTHRETVWKEVEAAWAGVEAGLLHDAREYYAGK